MGCLNGLAGCDANIPLLSRLVQWLRQVPDCVTCVAAALTDRLQELTVALRQELIRVSDGGCTLMHPAFMLQSAQFARYDGDNEAAFQPHVDNFGSSDDKRLVNQTVLPLSLVTSALPLTPQPCSASASTSTSASEYTSLELAAVTLLFRCVLCPVVVLISLPV